MILATLVVVFLAILTFGNVARAQFSPTFELRYDDNEANMSGFRRIIADDDTAYVFDFLVPGQGIHIFHISETDGLGEASDLNLEERPPDAYLDATMALVGNELVVQTARDGLAIIDVSDSHRPSLVNRDPGPKVVWWGSAVAGTTETVFAMYSHTDSYSGLIRQFRVNGEGLLELD